MKVLRLLNGLNRLKALIPEPKLLFMLSLCGYVLIINYTYLTIKKT